MAAIRLGLPTMFITRVKLAEAERWEHLAQKERASRFKEIGLMAMGPNTINGDLRRKKMG
jgi:hypothetical protein